MTRRPLMAMLLLTALSLGTAAAAAAPFLRSNDYPADGPQPTEFLLYFDGSTTPVVTPAVKNPDTGLLCLHYDLASLKPGRHKVAAKARNAWSESELSAPPFDFPAGSPSVPSGLGITAR